MDPLVQCQKEIVLIKFREKRGDVLGVVQASTEKVLSVSPTLIHSKSPIEQIEMLQWFLLLTAGLVCAYDPDDKLLETVLPKTGPGKFEAFYPRQAYGVANGLSRPPHGHATFYQHRHPALVDANNAPAYGFRFDGKRRFNFD